MRADEPNKLRGESNGAELPYQKQLKRSTIRHHQNACIFPGSQGCGKEGSAFRTAQVAIFPRRQRHPQLLSCRREPTHSKGQPKWGRFGGRGLFNCWSELLGPWFRHGVRGFIWGFALTLQFAALSQPTRILRNSLLQLGLQLEKHDRQLSELVALVARVQAPLVHGDIVQPQHQVLSGSDPVI